MVTDPGGISVGGITSGAGSTSKESGPISGAGSGSAGRGSGTSASSSEYGPPPGTVDPTVIPIPPAVRGSTASFEGEIYAEADSYVLHGPDLRMGIPVPGNELCVDGNIVRTLYRSKQAQKITNIALCTSRNVGDDDVWICPPGADSRAVVFDGYLASPIHYEIHTCLAYDRSNCYQYLDGGNPIEVCRQVKYDGIWAANTQFHYRCIKSETQKFSHSLQYTVRFRQEVEVIGVGIVSLVVASETRWDPLESTCRHASLSIL